MTRKINYKSDFKLFLSGNFTSPFRLTIYTSGNRQGGYTVSFDGQSYQSCSIDGWGRLVVAVNNHNMGLGNLLYDIESFLTDSDFADGVCDVYATALPVVDAEGNFYVLTAQGETDVDFDATIPPFYQIGPQGPQGEPGPQGPQGETVSVVNDLTTGGSDKALSAEMGKYIAQVVGEGVKETIHCNALCIYGGYYTSSTGEIVSNSSYKYTKKIELTNITMLDVTGAYQTRIFYWGTDGTTFLGTTTSAIVKAADFPNGAKYCSMNYPDNSSAEIIIYYSISPYIFGVQQGELGYTKLTFPLGNYNIIASTGEQEYSETWNSILGYIPLYNASSVYVPLNSSLQGVICFYDENFTYIEGSAYTQYKQVPANAKYCKIRVASGTLSYSVVDVYLYGATFNLSNVENTRKTIANVSPKSLVGKTVAFLGDSITAANLYGLYTRQFAEISGATVTSYGSAGKCYADGEIAGQAASLTGTENVVVMMGGTNDFNQSKVIGDIYEESDGGIAIPSSTTFCGGLHNAIQAVYAKCPTAQVVIITPPQKSNGWTKNSVGKYLYEYADAIKNVAKLYGIPVVDQFANCGINPVMPAMKSKYFNSDGTHPNHTYHMLLARWLYNAIATWVKEPYE